MLIVPPDPQPPPSPTEEERRYYAELATWLREETGYQWIQGTKPQTLAYALADSPAGFNAECADTETLFVRNFSGFDYVVAPSGSCVHHVRDNFDAIEQTAEVKEVRARTYEIVEFLHDILKVDAFP